MPDSGPADTGPVDPGSADPPIDPGPAGTGPAVPGAAGSCPVLDARARALLDAQVAFLARDLTDARFVALAGEEIDHALAVATRLTLDDVVDRTAVQAVARKYV
ncbi:MAG: hypothetical protein AB7G37_18990, partial [Solirubrobacteraceae bacterium]